MTDTPIRILCVDDNRAVTEALKLKIDLEPDLAWTGANESADGLCAAVERSGATIVLLDIDMPGADAFAELQRLTAARPAARVIMMTGYLRDDYVDRAMDAGAWGYVAKSEGPDAILATVRRVASGEIAFGPEVGKHYLHPARSKVASPATAQADLQSARAFGVLS